MRSQRSISGGYWEVWYLPGVYAASGDLRLAIDDKKEELRKRGVSDRDKIEKDCFDAALEFIRTHVQFGSLDISVQRLCMVAE